MDRFTQDGLVKARVASPGPKLYPSAGFVPDRAYYRAALFGQLQGYTPPERRNMHAGLYDDEPHGRERIWIMLANRAARGLASLRVQANEIGLGEAGQFHGRWTPRGWSDPNSRLVGFEQLLYLRQPGYGPSYIIGKVQLDDLLAIQSRAAETEGRPFVLGEAM